MTVAFTLFFLAVAGTEGFNSLSCAELSDQTLALSGMLPQTAEISQIIIATCRIHFNY